MPVFIGDDLLDDGLVGSLHSDDIQGLGGNDFLAGLIGDDVLNGGAGADVIVGGIGDDTMLGGDGNDKITATAGDDVVFGGRGSDTYFVNGFAGDWVTITDTQGKADWLNFAGGLTRAVIDLNPGALSFVDDRTIELTGVTKDSERPLELVLLEDLSGSFSDDVTTVRGLADDLIASVSGLATTVRLGLASFIDKPTGSFGSSGDHEYKSQLGLTTDYTAWKTALDGLTIGSGGDGPEAQMSGLMQAALRGAELGWSSDATKVIVLATDAVPHWAGDFPSVPANDGDAVTDGPGNDGTGEDYPSLEQVRDALLKTGIVPVFAVTAFNIDAYKAIVADLGVGSVVELSSDSSDIINAIESGISKATETVIENVKGTNFADKIVGNAVGNEIRGKGGNDTIFGRKGGDLLLGGLGRDRLDGDRGNDELWGGLGKDKLIGDAGNDTFGFDLSGPPPGVDIVLDFTDGSDSIRVLDDTLLTFADITVTSKAAGTLLSSGGVDFALLKGVAASDIDASDFSFGLA